MFKFLMNNFFVKFKGKIYRQVIGIPMGCDCAPKTADLFLYWYEHNYISEAKPYVYPEQLSLECTTYSSNRSYYLDLDILVKK